MFFVIYQKKKLNQINPLLIVQVTLSRCSKENTAFN